MGTFQKRFPLVSRTLKHALANLPSPTRENLATEIEGLAALRAENERLQSQCAQLAARSGMLSAVHGALIDAGCTVGEIGRCEADLVRELAEALERLRAELSLALCAAGGEGA